MFSFSDLFEHLRDFRRSNIRPARKALTADKRALFCSFAVLVLLEMLLGILILSRENNVYIAGELQKDCAVYEKRIRKEADPNEELLAAIASLSENTAKLNRTDSAIFLFAVAVWFGVSWILMSGLISSDTEQKQFVLGLYVTFGAHTKKLRRMLFLQMTALGLAALPFATACACTACNAVYGYLPNGLFYARDVWIPAVLVTLLLFVATGPAALRATSKSCVELLSSADVSSCVHPPRRSSMHISMHAPFQLACAALYRMRGHCAALVLSAALPASLFFCCLSLANGGAAREENGAQEYTLTYAAGFSASRYNNDLKPDLEQREGVAGTDINSETSADEIGLHLLLAENETAGAEPSAVGFDTAYTGVKLLSADPYSLQKQNLASETGEAGGAGAGGFGIPTPAEGTVTAVYPRTVYGSWPMPHTPKFSPAGTVFISGSDPALQSLPPEQIVQSSAHMGSVLTVNKPITVGDIVQHNEETGEEKLVSQRLQDEFLILHPADFQRLTGIDVQSNAARGIATDPVRLSDVGGYIATRGQCASHGLPSVRRSLGAENRFSVAVGDASAAARYKLPQDTPLPSRPGEATLVLNSASVLSPSLKFLRLSRPALSPAPSPSDLQLSRSDRLLLSLGSCPQEYTVYTVCAAVYSDLVPTSSAVILMTEEDLAKACGRTDAYTQLSVKVDPNAKLSALCELLVNLRRRTETGGINGTAPELRERGELWDSILTSRFHYSAVMRLIAVPLLLLLPLVLYSRQSNHYRKRRQDLEVLRALGQTPRQIRKLLLYEGLLLAALNTLILPLLCLLFTSVAYAFLRFNEFPFAYGFFDPAALFTAIAFSALSTLGSVLFHVAGNNARTINKSNQK